MTHRLVARSPGELAAAVPLILGFKPTDSIVCGPLGAGPWARIDHPYDEPDLMQVAEALLPPIQRHSPPRVVLLSFTANRPWAERATAQLGRQLTPDIAVALRLHVDEQGRWTDLATGATGSVAADARKMAAAAAYQGMAMPEESRQELEHSYVGDPGPITAVLDGGRDATAADQHPESAQAWVRRRVRQFLTDQNRLTDPEAARVLTAIQDIPVRDVVLQGMTRQNATLHHALWRDLTRRAPDTVRTPAAALAGFSAWLSGSGARAWCALDRIPHDRRDYRLAQLVAVALQEGAPPEAWDERLATGSAGGGTAAPDRSPTPGPKARPEPRPRIARGGQPDVENARHPRPHHQSPHRTPRSPEGPSR